MSLISKYIYMVTLRLNKTKNSLHLSNSNMEQKCAVLTPNKLEGQGS